MEKCKLDLNDVSKDSIDKAYNVYLKEIGNNDRLTFKGLPVKVTKTLDYNLRQQTFEHIISRDTNSKQYKAAIKQMMSNANGAMYGNIQGIKNLMKSYDKDGDYINPVNGLAGLLVTDENENSRKRIISIPDSSKEEMYELTKKEFLRENGVHNGDTTKRTDVYNNLYRKMSKKDRLAAGYTLEKYERIYRQAFYDAAKKADSNWEIGKPIKDGALDSVTRESVETEKSLTQSTVDTKI